MAKATLKTLQEVELYLALLKRDEYVEPNLTEGPPDRIVSWAMIRRTVPCSFEVYEAIRGFPDA